MKFKSIHVLILLITLFNPVSILASESADFAIAFVNGINTSQRAVDHLKTVPSDDDMMSLMKDNYVFINRLEEAKGYVVPFKKSSNKKIATTANSLCDFYDAFIENTRGKLDFLEEIMNNPANTRQGTLVRKMAEHQAKTDAVYRILPVITAGVANTLVDANRLEDGKIMFLTLTREERTSIKELLIRQFGERTLTSKENKFPLEVSASLFWKFLSDPWKSADDK
jgi:hypothetical protein